jgi:hypothetical protein
MIQPSGASIAKLLAMPQPRIAYTPSVTCSTRFVSPMPHISLASSAVLVVIAPFGPTTVSLRSDGLLHDGGGAAAPSVDWAPSDAARAKTAHVRIMTTRIVTASLEVRYMRRAKAPIYCGTDSTAQRDALTKMAQLRWRPVAHDDESA